MAQQQFYTHPALKKEFKKTCKRVKKSMSKVLNIAMEKFILENKEK